MSAMSAAAVDCAHTSAERIWHNKRKESAEPRRKKGGVERGDAGRGGEGTGERGTHLRHPAQP